MIGIDVTPLVLGPRTGVARALHQLMLAWHARPPHVPMHPVSPDVLPSDVPRLSGAVRPNLPLHSHRALRAAMPQLVRENEIRVLFSPWSAVAELDVPVVAWVHEAHAGRPAGVDGWGRAWTDRRWLRRNVEECAALIVPSRATERDVLARHPFAAPLIHRIPNAFDPTPWRVEGLLPARTPYVLAIGVGTGRSGARKKGIDVLFAAWQTLPLPGHELVLVGRPAFALPRGVRIVEAPDDDELRRLLGAATMLVYPSRMEGFGYPPLEAMAAGVPVVAADAGSIPEVVEEAALLVPPGDAMALAAAMRRVADDAGLRERLVHAGFRRSKAFDPQPIARRVADLLIGVARKASL